MLCAILITFIIILALLVSLNEGFYHALIIVPLYFIYKWLTNISHRSSPQIIVGGLENSIGTIKKMKRDGIEIEAVFHINNYQYDLLKKKLSEYTKPIHSVSKVEISDNIRKITDSKIRWEQKNSEIIAKYDDYKIRKASETKITPPKQFVPKIVRNRVRDTFILKDYKNVQFDLTRVVSGSDSVEFEIELLQPSGDFENAIKFIQYILLEGTLPFKDGERTRVIEQHNILASKLTNRPRKVGEFIVGYENKPKDLAKQDLLNDYYVTLKYDGTRRFLLTLKTDEGRI
jgi:hypothetical protein